MRRIMGAVGLCLLCGGVSALSAAENSEVPQEFRVAEDAAPGTTIGRVKAGDQGPGTGVTFQIAPDGATVPWRIDPITGELTLGDAYLDFESQPRYELTVRVRSPRALDPARRAYLADLLASGVDPDSLDDVLFQVAEKVVAVDVADAPERPVLSAAKLTLVARNGAEPAQVQITVADPDAGETHTFELVDSDPQQFAIDPRSGVLTCLKAADTADGTIPVTVRVTDSAGLSTTATYNVELVVPATAVAVSSTSNAAESPTAAASPPLTPPASINDDVPPDMDDEPTVAAAPAPPVEAANDVAPPTATHPAAAESNPESAAVALVATPDQVEEAAPAAASQGGLAIWLPLTVLAVGLVVLGVFWLRRRREPPVMDAQPPRFRVVREARMLNAASAAGARESEESPANTPAFDADTVANETAAVHQLLASALQQAVGKPEAESAPVAVAEPQAILSPPPEIVPSVDVERPVAVEVPADIADLTPIAEAAIDDQPASPVEDRFEPVEAASALSNTIAGVLPELPAQRWDLEDPAPAPTAWLPQNMVADEDLEPIPDTEAVVRSSAAGDTPEVYDDVPSDISRHTDADSFAADAGAGPYHAVDEDEPMSVYGLRLSQPVAPPTHEELAGAMRQPEPSELTASRERLLAGGESRVHEGDDPKLRELRRQLSDLFGVPADRPRPIEPEVMEDAEPQPVEEPAGMALEEPPATGTSPEPMAEVAPPAADTAPVSTMDPSDPVSSWLAYVKQRAMEQSSPSARPAVPVPPPPPPAPAPAAHDAAAIPVPSISRARRELPPAAVAKVDKTAVREEISMLRDVANQYSRKILEQRAMHRRARSSWVIWGTIMVLLSFAGLALVKQSSGVLHMLGWGLFAGAAIALGGCIQGFRNLSARAEADSWDAGENDSAATDLEQTLAPELMSPEMEAKLRSVLEESHATASVGAGNARE